MKGEGKVENNELSVQERNFKAAKDFITAIKTIAENPANLDHLEGYLSYHFTEWMSRYASTPEGLAAEMKEFAEMDI